MENMWNFNNEEVNEESPKAILEQQGKLLPSLTGDMVYASVDEENWVTDPLTFNKGDFIYSFNLKSKFLPNYSFEVLALTHSIPIYPVKMNLDEEIKKELSIGREVQFIIIPNEDEFRNQLRLILSSKRISSVISSIMKLSK